MIELCLTKGGPGGFLGQNISQDHSVLCPVTTVGSRMVEHWLNRYGKIFTSLNNYLKCPYNCQVFCSRYSEKPIQGDALHMSWFINPTSYDQYPLVNKHSNGKSPFLMGQSTISMAIFHCYVSSPESIYPTKPVKYEF